MERVVHLCFGGGCWSKQSGVLTRFLSSSHCCLCLTESRVWVLHWPFGSVCQGGKADQVNQGGKACIWNKN